MKIHIILISLGVSPLTSAASLASSEPAWGTQSFADVRRSTPFNPSPTDFTFNSNLGDNDGGPGAEESSARDSSPPRGATRAESTGELNFRRKTVTITGSARGSANFESAIGGSIVVEGYIYSGVGTATFNLNATLSGAFSGFNLDNGDLAENFATLSVFGPGSVDMEPIENFFFSDDENEYLESGFNRLSTLNLAQNTNTDSVLSDTLSWDMEPGDTVYSWTASRSQAFADGTTSASAEHTLLTSFQNGAIGLARVPEPSVSLFGLLSVFVLSHRKRT